MSNDKKIESVGDLATNFIIGPEKELEVVNFTNIDKEDYTGTFGGRKKQVGFYKDNSPKFATFPVEKIIKSGATIPLPRSQAEHNALHLSQKIAIREKADFNDVSFIKPLYDKIIGEIGVEVEEVKNVSTKENIGNEEFEGLEDVIMEEKRGRGRPKKETADIK